MASAMVHRRTRIKIMANISIPSLVTGRRNNHGLRFVTWLELSLSRYTERRRLRQLDENALKDIGLSQADAEREASRWPWDGSERARFRC